MTDHINGSDPQKPMTALGHQWWLFRVVFEMRPAKVDTVGVRFLSGYRDEQ